MQHAVFLWKKQWITKFCYELNFNHQFNALLNAQCIVMHGCIILPYCERYINDVHCDPAVNYSHISLILLLQRVLASAWTFQQMQTIACSFSLYFSPMHILPLSAHLFPTLQPCVRPRYVSTSVNPCCAAVAFEWRENSEFLH